MALDLGAMPLYAFYKSHLAAIRSVRVLRIYHGKTTMSLVLFFHHLFYEGAGVNNLSTMLYIEIAKELNRNRYGTFH